MLRTTRSWERGLLALGAATVLVTSCGIQKAADSQFGDQHFKTAIALIELYRVRHGSYPEMLSALDFTGSWDLLALQSVEYHRLTDGYELNITRGWVGKPALEYPPAFFAGLGLRQTNVGHLTPVKK